jgi:DNA-binding response OmpR family regulator
MQPNVLVVEDDDVLSATLASILEAAGYRVCTAADGERALELLNSRPFAVVLTDIKMRRVDGIDVLIAAKRQQPTAAVIILTGFAEVESAIAALRAGAYDYLRKPCAPVDLLRCVAAALERQQRDAQAAHTIAVVEPKFDQLGELTVLRPRAKTAPCEQNMLAARFEIGALQIDTERRSVVLDDKLINLTATEFMILICLAEAGERVLTYSDIVYCTHGFQSDKREAQRLLKAHMHNLRAKLDPAYIISVRGIGYMLAVPQAER